MDPTQKPDWSEKHNFLFIHDKTMWKPKLTFYFISVLKVQTNFSLVVNATFSIGCSELVNISEKLKGAERQLKAKQSKTATKN